MWSYYGSKQKIAKLYPKPLFDTIVEPFAGAAWYSVTHRGKQCILNEKYEVVVDIWNWLINQATPEEILEHKDFLLGDDVRELGLSKPHEDLIGFCINRGTSSPCNIVQKWSCQVKSKPSHASTTEFSLKRIASLIPEIKHWKILSGDYRELPDIEATWFIDPPYQKGGQYYKHNLIDYEELANWCKSRRGQVIVCENDVANWLNFTPLVGITGQRKKTMETMWTNMK